MTDSTYAPTSPDLPTDSGIVHTGKEFSDALTLELPDSDIDAAMKLIVSIRQKYLRKFIARFNDYGTFQMEEAEEAIEEMADEMEYRLATEHSILAHVDGRPVLDGEPPNCEIIGVLPDHATSQYGMDHERKEWEVKKATDRGEDWLGQKGNTDATKAKNRDRNR